MRGIRQQLHWHQNPQYRFATRGHLRATRGAPQCRAAGGLRLVFDLQVFASQMAGAAELAAACPRVTFVLQHAGMLEDLTPRRPRLRGEAGMKLLAAAQRRREAVGLSAPSSTATMPTHIELHHRRDGRAVRRRPLPVRLELSRSRSSGPAMAS
jgi:predicted TIM-barrel fold metal-dependent hydrolase